MVFSVAVLTTAPPLLLTKMDALTVKVLAVAAPVTPNVLALPATQQISSCVAKAHILH